MNRPNALLHIRTLTIVLSKVFLALLATSFLALVMAFTLISSSSTVRIYVLNSALNLVNSEKFSIDIDSIESPSINHWKISKLVLRQEEKPTLQIVNAEFEWQTLALLYKKLEIDRVNIEHLYIYYKNLPVSELKSENEKPTLSELINLATQYDVHLNEFKIANLHFPEFSLKTKALPVYSISSTLDLRQDSRISLKLQVQNSTESSLNVKDGTKSEFNLNLHNTQDNTIILSARLNENANGYWSNYLALPNKQAIDAKIQASIEQATEGYSLTLQTFEVPIAQHMVVANSELLLNQDLNTVEIDYLDITIGEHTHHIDGNWGAEYYDLNILVYEFPLSILSPWNLPLSSGHFNFDGKLFGPTKKTLDKVKTNNKTGTKIESEFLTKLQVKGKAELHSQYQGENLDLTLKGAGSLNTVTFENFNIKFGQALAFGKAQINLIEKTTKLEVHIAELEHKTIERFEISLPEELNFKIEKAELALEGPLKNPNGQLKLYATGSYQGEFFQLNAEANKVNDTLKINRAKLNLAEGFSELSGNIYSLIQIIEKNKGTKIRTSAELKGTFNNLPIVLLRLVGLTIPDDLNANINGKYRIGGKLSNPIIDIDGTLDGYYQEVPFSLSTSAEYNNRQTKITLLNLRAFNESVLDITGGIQEKHVDLQLDAKQLPTQLLHALNISIKPGDFSANVHISGPLPLPSITGNIEYKTNIFKEFNNSDKVSSLLQWHIDIDTDEKNYILRSTVAHDNSTPDHISFSFPMFPYRTYFDSNANTALPLVANIDGEMDLHSLSLFFDPELHYIKGNLETEIQINGDILSPRFSGHVQINNGSYENPLSGTHIKDINCLINTQQVHINIKECDASDDDKGKLKLSGDIYLPNTNTAGAIDLTLKAKNAQVIRRHDIESQTTGDIRLHGDFDSLLAEGELDVAPLTAIIDVNHSSGIPKIKTIIVDNSSKKSAQDLPLDETDIVMRLPIVTLNLAIKAEQKAFLRGHGLEAELKGKINLRGKASKPSYDGVFNTVRGTFEIFGKKFTINQGLVNFNNDVIGLNIEAEYSRNNQEIVATISGTASNLKIKFTASPEMPEDEILAFIIFGKAVQNITPVEAIQLAIAVQNLRGGSQFIDPIGKARELLGVDTLTLESSDTTSDSSDGGLSVGIGKYLNDRVYLEFTRTSNSSQPWKSTLEIELTPSIQLQSSSGGETGLEGLELIWKHDY